MSSRIPAFAVLITVGALLAPASSQCQLAIVPAQQHRGFVITQFASGFAWRDQGIAFLPGGAVLVSDPLGGGENLYRFPDHADGQVANAGTLIRSAPDVSPNQMVQVLDNGVWRYYGNFDAPYQDIAELDTTGAPIRYLGLNMVYPNCGMAAFPPGVSSPYAGHIFFALPGNSLLSGIYEVDPVTSVVTQFANLWFVNHQQILISPDGATLYAAIQVEVSPGQYDPYVVALAIPGGYQTWSSPSHPNGVGSGYRGMALGAGTLDGYLYVSDALNIWEFGLPGGPHAGVDSLLATRQPGVVNDPLGNMFADPFAPCPGGNPSLLVSDEDMILRIDPPGGGWFGCPTSTLTTGGSISSAPDAARAGNVLRLAIARNPSFGSVDVSFTLDKAGDVRLEVLDTQGRIVAVLDNRPRTAGVHRVTWNGMTDGEPVPAGIYFVRLRNATRSAIARVTLLN